MSYPIYWVPASSQDFVQGRNGKTIIAIVHHRMVGTLSGTDTTFQSRTNRPVSTHFGIGNSCAKSGHPTAVHIHQYVDLSDTAFGNGNYDSSGKWDDWGYPTTEINARTVSIEHQDNAHLASGSGKGVVPEPVIRASIWLDRLLLTGDPAKMRAAGIRVRSDSTAAMLGRIKPGPRTLITHNDIAGRLKPYCWLPWADDKVGYPRSRYVTEAAATTPLPDISTGGDTVKSFAVPEARILAKVKADTWLYDNSDMQPSATNIQLNPGRELVYVGQFSASPDIRIVAYEPAAGDTNSTSKAMFVARDGIESFRTVADTTPFSQEDVDKAVAAATAAIQTTVNEQAATIASLKTELAAAAQGAADYQDLKALVKKMVA